MGTTTQLLDRLREDPRDDEAWDELLKRLWNPLYDWFSRLLSGCNDLDPADATQELLLGIVEKAKLAKFDRTRGKGRTWLFAIVRNLSIDMHRREKIRRELTRPWPEDEPAATLDSHFQKLIVEEVLEDYLDELPEARREVHRAVVEKHVMLKVPGPEVARALGIPEHQVYRIKNRVIKKVKPYLEPPS